MERVFSHVGLSRISLFITMRLFCSQAVCMSYANASKLVSVDVLLFYRKNYFYLLLLISLLSFSLTIAMNA
jgi:hypothetical protein